MALIEITDLSVRYGEIEALRGITLSVDEGKVVTLLGSNGAGKSTTLRAISGFLGLDDARVTEGDDPGGPAAGELGVGFAVAPKGLADQVRFVHTSLPGGRVSRGTLLIEGCKTATLGCVNRSKARGATPVRPTSPSR